MSTVNYLHTQQSSPSGTGVILVSGPIRGPSPVVCSGDKDAAHLGRAKEGERVREGGNHHRHGFPGKERVTGACRGAAVWEIGGGGAEGNSGGLTPL